MPSKVRKKISSGETLDGRELPPAPNLNQPEGRTELANARRFISRHGDKLRFVPSWGKWIVWRGTHWQIDDDCLVEGMARDVVEAVWKEAAHLMRSADSSDAPAVLSFARATASAPGMAHFLHLARSEPGIPIQPGELDRNEWLFNVQNGTIDLRTCQRRAHSKADFITKLAPVVHSDHVRSELWERFVSQIMAGDVELIGFLQRLCGYWLTGSVRDQVLPIFHGAGANGKSVFLGTIEAMLGPDYAMHAPPDLLMMKRHESHPTERADLFGKRLVTCVETEYGRRLAESLVKELTGADAIRARRMREDHWQFHPTHKLVIAANHKPIVNGTDYGIWRRLRLVPFNVTFAPQQQDKTLAERLKKELTGILSWCIDGCLAWQSQGLAEPSVVSGATDAYRDEQDILGEFFADCCHIDSALSAPAGQLFAAYVGWCQQNGYEPDNSTVFGRKLTERGFPVRKVGGTKSRLGIALAQAPSAPGPRDSNCPAQLR